MSQPVQINARDALIAGGFASVVGLFIIAVSIWGDGSGFHAPRWVVGAAGGVFLLAGLAIFTQDHPILSSLLRALLLTSFGAVFTWVSFGPGEREFSSSVPNVHPLFFRDHWPYLLCTWRAPFGWRCFVHLVLTRSRLGHARSSRLIYYTVMKFILICMD